MPENRPHNKPLEEVRSGDLVTVTAHRPRGMAKGTFTATGKAGRVNPYAGAGVSALEVMTDQGLIRIERTNLVEVVDAT